VTVQPPAPRSGDVERLQVDVLVIGAGFGGLYALHKLRQRGLSVLVLEQGDAVGGTWFWNRYPGARCDIESIEYSYSFNDGLQQEWVWNDILPPQAEVEAYLNHVADRFDLRRDIKLGTRVSAAMFDEEAASWSIETETNEHISAQYVVAATGILSAPLDPGIPGMETFAGTSLFTHRFPQQGFDFTGKRVAVIGTGSSGVQAIPVIAPQAAHLYVLQRSAAYTFPSTARPFAIGELDELKSRYDQIRVEQKAAHPGTTRSITFLMQRDQRPPLRTASRDEQIRAIEEHGVRGAMFWSDVMTDRQANEMARQLYGEAIGRVVKDPETAASLVPHYPFGCKRPIIDQGYFETFNRDNVTLVDLRKGGIERITPEGIETRQAFCPVDVIVYATGFDASTGPLSAIDVVGRRGATLRDVWRQDGPVSYLGIQVAGFPNLFTVTGPGSPSALSNVVTSIEQHVDWIAECIAHMSDHGHRSVECDAEAQTEWTQYVNSLVEGTILLDPSCHSWWNGANMPGKKRMILAYVGGVPEYRRRCDEVASSGYPGFRFG
jgi:cation diffusion facilitator CzcD-associated flavoprotein CzcO